MAQARARSLVAVFDTETHAQQAARKMEALGVAHDEIRVGDSLDALASVQGEMRQEASGVVAGPGTGPVTKGASRGILFGAIVGAVAGLAVALPFAAIPMGDLSASTRLWIVAAVGLVFGWFLGWYLGGAFGLDRPEEPLAASRGATLAIPDSDTARQVLVETGSLRVDVIAADGEPVGQLVADHPTPARKVGEIAGDIVRHAREEPTKG
jgi:hypothetical protein